MTHYPHFVFPNLFLLNGYRETQTHRGLELVYEQEDDLEQCIRCLLLRKPERLRGWDLRFLRRGLGLSQADVGAQVDRDAQTVARWEKSADPIPGAIDLAIRTRFAARFAPKLSTREILSYVDGTGNKLPDSIYLRFTNHGWEFEREPKVKFAQSTATADARVQLGANLGVVYRLPDLFVGNAGPLSLELTHRGKILETKVLEVHGKMRGDKVVAMEAELPKPIGEVIASEPPLAKTQQLKVDIKGSAYEQTSATIH